MDRRGARKAATAPAARPARGVGDRCAPCRPRARDDARRRRGAGARRLVRAHRDPRPAHPLGLVLYTRHAVIQLEARPRAVRRSRLRRRARALPSPRAESLTQVLEARRDAPPRLARPPRLAAPAPARIT